MWRSAPSPRGEGAPIATCLLLLMEILISQKLLYTTPDYEYNYKYQTQKKMLEHKRELLNSKQLLH